MARVFHDLKLMEREGSGYDRMYEVLLSQATRYFVDPVLLQKLEFPKSTTLSLIEPHRLKALILEDLQRYPESAISDIHSRIAPELDRHRIKLALEALYEEGAVHYHGEKRWRRYALGSE
jgi:ATP-dependent DNA helicase RecG